MSRPPGPAARVYLVGELRVERGETVYRFHQLGSRKARVVLALLASDPGAIRPAREIADALWPTCPPESAEATVASLVSRLRRTLGTELITGARSGYRLGRAPDVEVDLDRAGQLVAEAERRLAADQPALAGAAASTALTLLVGTPLADSDDADWVRAARSQHTAVLRRARSAAGRAALDIGEHSQAVAAARAALDDDPIDEDAARILMTALAATGEPARALQVFDVLRHHLADELGSDPAAATSELHALILRGTVSPSHPSGTGRADRGRLVGREREFAVLSAAWSAAASGHGSLVLVTGEAGAGKTRLADELCDLAMTTGGMLLSARCYEAEHALFLQPFVEAVTDAVTRFPPAQLVAAASQHRDSLARLVPAFGALVAAPSTDIARVEVERRRAIEAMSAFLCGLSRDQPVLVDLDDLHNAGSSSIELLHFLRTVLPTHRLLVVATVRDHDGTDVIAALRAVATRVPVGPLPAPAVRRLAVDAGQGHRAEEIVRRTGGHALFVTEVLRDPSGELPETLQAAVLTRTARAGADAEAVLRAGAVLGASFDPQQAAVLAGLSRAQGLAACEQALQVGLLRTAGRSYEFANDLVREVLYATTPTPTRLAHHAQAADLLSGTPEQVAIHATAIEDWSRAAHAWLLAAENAVECFAAADGAALAERALAAADRAGEPELTGRALIVRGRARDAQADYDAAWQDFTAAVEAARDTGDQRLEMIALREIAGNVPVALGYAPALSEQPLQRCLSLARGLGARTTEVDVLGRLTVLAVTRLDFAAALDHSARALRLARGSNDEHALELALDARKNSWAYLGEIQRLDEVLQELEPLNRRNENLVLLQWTLFESALVPLAARHYSEAMERIEAALAVCRRSGYTPFEPFYTAHLAWVHRLAGDLDTALSIGATAVDAAREHRHAWWVSTSAGLHAAALLETGARAQAAELLEEVRPWIEVPGAEAYVARCLGPLAEAGGSLEVLHAADRLLRGASAPDGSAWLVGADVYLSVARAWRRHGRPDRAAATLAEFLAAARRVGWPDLVRAGEHALSQPLQ